MTMMSGADSVFWPEDPLPVPTTRVESMIYLGIDPGVSGGIAVIDDGGTVIATFKLDGMSERDIVDTLDTWNPQLARHDGTKAVLERVGASPQMGVTSAFTFGRWIGALRMALTACRIPFDEVTPQKWQAVMGCRSRGDKNVTKRRAQQLFPSRTITHAIADALLMAEYCRRVERGSIQRTRQEHISDGKEGTQGEARDEGQGPTRSRFHQTRRPPAVAPGPSSPSESEGHPTPRHGRLQGRRAVAAGE